MLPCVFVCVCVPDGNEEGWDSQDEDKEDHNADEQEPEAQRVAALRAFAQDGRAVVYKPRGRIHATQTFRDTHTLRENWLLKIDS